MGYSSISVAMILAGMLVALAVWLTFAISRNIDRGHVRRRHLAEGVDGLRLGTMLDRLGEDRDHYLHQKRIVDIEQHMQRCGDCGAVDCCDDVLSKDKRVRGEQVDFCPNIADLR